MFLLFLSRWLHVEHTHTTNTQEFFFDLYVDTVVSSSLVDESFSRVFSRNTPQKKNKKNLCVCVMLFHARRSEQEEW